MRAFLAIFMLTAGMLLGFDYVVKPWIAPSRPQPVVVAMPEPVKPVTGTRVVSPVVTVAAVENTVAAETAVLPARSEPALVTQPPNQVKVDAPVPVARESAPVVQAAPAVPAPLVFRAAVEAESVATGVDPAASATAEEDAKRTSRVRVRRAAKAPVRTADQSRKKVQDLFTNPLGRY